MPELSRFFGIVVYIIMEPNSKHHKPHIHARCSGDTISIDIESISILEGSLPHNKQGKLIEWCRIHQDELKSAWDKVSCGELPDSIAPLE